MNDSYAEWLVKRKEPAYNYLIKAFLIFLCVIGLIAALLLPLGIIILTILGAVAYFSFQRLSVEFEYLVVNDQVTIDVIMGKSKRKKAWEGTMSEIQIVAPKDSYLLKDYEKHGMKVLDFTSHTPEGKVYGMIHQNGTSTQEILFEPNEKLLACMGETSPRMVIQ